MRSRPSPRPQHRPPRRHERFFAWVESRAKRLALVGIVLLILESGYLGWAVLHERSDRQHQVNTAICSIIKAIPPGNMRIDEVRHSFKCGAFIPPAIPTRPTATPSASRSISHHPKPRPRKSKVIVRTTTQPGEVYTTTVPHTVVKTQPGKTVTRTTRPRPSSSPPGGIIIPPIPDPLCMILPGLCKELP